MDLDIPVSAQALRSEMRTFLANELPAEFALKTLHGEKLTKDDHQRWQRILQARGWLAPSWPMEWGGPGWGPL